MDFPATPIISSYSLGLIFGLGTAVLWCFSSLAFEEAGKRIGSLQVNVFRLVVAFTLLSAVGFFTRGQALPTDATAHQWKWLLASGFVGFFLGDLASFRALVLVGSRVCALVTCTAPIFALAAEMVLLKDSPFSLSQCVGIAVTLAGVAWVVVEKNQKPLPVSAQTIQPDSHTTVLDYAPAQTTTLSHYKLQSWGLVLAFIGAACQGVGAVLTKNAFSVMPYDAFSTGQIRIMASLPFFVLFVMIAGKMRDTAAAIRNPVGLLYAGLGALGGPFLGVTLFTLSLQHVPPTVTQTLVSLVPIMMLPIAYFFRREHITWRALAGTLVAVAGVYLLVNADGISKIASSFFANLSN